MALCTAILNEIDNHLHIHDILIKCVIVRVVQNGYTTNPKMFVVKLVEITYINLRVALPFRAICSHKSNSSYFSLRARNRLSV